jgi:hypothetical protein
MVALPPVVLHVQVRQKIVPYDVGGVKTGHLLAKRFSEADFPSAIWFVV